MSKDDGDNKADIAVFRAPQMAIGISKALRRVSPALCSERGRTVPTPADYDGDGKADVAVFRPSSGVWYLQQSTQGFRGIAFGVNGDKPAPNAFIP